MAYLGNGIYDLLDVVRASNNPQINYEGLYQDAPSNIATSNLLQAMKPGYEFRNPDYINYQIRKGSMDLAGNVPTDFNRIVDFKRYFDNKPLRPTDGRYRFEDFNPRVGRPEQFINYNYQPDFINAPQDDYASLYSTQPDFINAPQDDYESLYYNQLPYSGVGDMGYTTPRTIADQNRILGQTFTEQKPSGIAKLFQFLGNIPTPMNILRGGLESLRGFNKKIRGTTFALSPTLKDYVQAKRAEKRAAAGADVGVGPGGSGSRRGDADIASRDRGSFRTDDTAGFF